MFMWMNDVPIGLLSLSNTDYLQSFLDGIIVKEYEYFKELMRTILIKGFYFLN